MSRIVVYGAGGRAGRAAVGEASARGHQVTGVVRDPAKYRELEERGVALVAGDASDPTSIAATAGGHDAAVIAVYDTRADPKEFFVHSAEAALEGLPRAGVGRAVVVGLVSNLEVAPGVRMFDTPDFPEAFRAFAEGHTAGLDTYRSADTELDWLVVTPPLVLDEGARKGVYRVGGEQLLTQADGTSHLSYADLAIALIDEIDTPRHHRTRISVAD